MRIALTAFLTQLPVVFVSGRGADNGKCREMQHYMNCGNWLSILDGLPKYWIE